MKKIKIISFVIGTILLANALAASLLSNMSAGLLMTYLLGAFFVLCGVFAEKIKKYVPCAIIYFVLSGVVLEAVFVLWIFAYGMTDNVTYEEDVIIVLGSGIRGEKVPPNLKNRLDAAYEYHKKNPDAIIVVSGGMGDGETITEALAMERYLFSLGVPGEKIIKEGNSTSTEENFRFSKAILDGMFDREYSVAFVTNDFHIFRASHWAKHAGFENVTHIHSGTPFWIVIPNGIRESMGIVKQVVFRS